MAIPESVINEIKYRNEIEEIISQYVVLKRRGKNLVGLCPFHNEKTPSFTVYPENGSFYCFGCGAGGDVFTFTKLIENLDYIEAVKKLAEKAGVALPDEGYDDSFLKLKNTVYEINRETAKFYHSFLMSPDGKWALDYLLGRGLTLQTIRHFGLGAAPDSWDALIKHLKSLGYSENDMLQANVVNKGQRGGFYDRFRKRVMFPIINIRGKVIAFSGRAMPGEDKEGGKYVNTADTPVYKKSDNIFGMNFAKNNCADRIILVEGNMDVVSLHQAGITNAVAALGTAFTEEQARLISRYTKEIVLCMDADAAGQKAVKRAGEILKNTGLEVRVITIPDGKDPDEYIKKNGTARFNALIEGAVSEIEYKLLAASRDVDTESDNGKVQYLNAAAQIIADTADIMTADIYIGRLSDKFSVSRVALEAKVKELRQSKRRQEQKKEFNQLVNPRYSKDDINPEKRNSPKGTAAEECVIAVLLQHPDLCEVSKELLDSEKMLTSLNRRIYERILELSDSGQSVDISYFGDMLSSAEMGYLVSLQNGEKATYNAKTVLKDSIKVILEEGSRVDISEIKEASVESWAQSLQKMIENKQKG